MKPKTLSVIALAAALALCFPVFSWAQSTPLPPPRTHSRPTRMGAKAQALQTNVAQEIEKEKAAGSNVTAAQKHKDQGDAALKIGHYRIAVEEYEAAQKALSTK
jgi:uncharacterized membrane protein YccC